MSVPMPKDDPAYFLLERGLKDPSKRTVATVYNPNCYICRDPEFALMGLPLCQPCPDCGSHTPADDEECDEGHNVREFYERQREIAEREEPG